MFDDLDAAREALAPYLGAAPLEAVLGALVPTVGFAPADAGRIGGTRVGGAPDLPPGLAWPRPPAPDDPEVVAARGNAAAGAEMRHHFALGLPHAFAAQVDLAEAAALGPAAADLPPDGRLLFFYDYATGPWDTGTRAARVIWDRAPRADLRPAEPPADLAAAADRDRAETGGFTVYGAPGRAMRLAVALRLPQHGWAELDALFDAAAARGVPSADLDGFRGAYWTALESLDTFDMDPDRRLQLLGSAIPEQDDPRGAAAVFDLYGRQHLSRDEWHACRDAIADATARWRLLLQLPVGAWHADDGAEGTVYFLIRAEDLAARRFDGVVAVYQQT